MRRFNVGDLVRILPFDEIKCPDKTDIECFGISKDHIDEISNNTYVISNVSGSTYSLKGCYCWWLDEMLAPVFEDESITIPDNIDELFEQFGR